MKYTGKLKGGPPMGPRFRLVDVRPDTDVIAVMVPEGRDPVPYIPTAGDEEAAEPTPETHLVVPVPVAIFKRSGGFRLHKGGMRATFSFSEMQEQSYTDEDPEAYGGADA